MNAKQLYLGALQQATEIVDAVRPEDYGKPTPAAEWSVKDLLQHMLYELSWVTEVLQGKTIQGVGDKYEKVLVDEALQVNWHTAADAAKHAVDAANPQTVTHLSYGDSSVGDYLREAGTDQLIHAWDLGAGIGTPVRFDDELVQAVYDYLLPHKDTLQQSGLFAPPVPVPDSADVQTRLLAITGRRVNWHA